MGATTGIQPVLTYTGSLGEMLALLLTLIPDPDSGQGGTGVRPGGQTGQGGAFLDEMSPAACAQLIVEIGAVQDALLGTGISDVAYGEHVITAGEATAGLVDIVTGLDDLTLSRSSISVWNDTTLATSDAVITESAAGTIRVADGTTYNTVAGYVVRWMARYVTP